MDEAAVASVHAPTPGARHPGYAPTTVFGELAMLDTIAALATAAGAASIGVVRLSGPRAIEIATELARLPAEPESHRAYVRELWWQGERLDEVVVLVFRGPRSFTGEDVVELQCHGGAWTLASVLDATLALGARVAEPGEFSRRAMQNGRLDLIQVEAIADVIASRSAHAHRQAQAHLAGRLSARVATFKDALASALVQLESAIDFSDEEHVFQVSLPELAGELAGTLAGIERLVQTYDDGRLRRSGVRVALIGRPNAGKSTVLNLLACEDRALVSPIAGTTRDYVEIEVELGGVTFFVVDTAGLRATEDAIESMGVERTRAQAAAADVVLCVVDATRPDAWESLRAELPDRPHAVLWNKADLLPEGERPHDDLGTESTGRALLTSAVNPASRDAVEGLILDLAREAGLCLTDGSVLVTRARHRGHLLDAQCALVRAMDACTAELSEEFVALDVRAALDALGMMTGAVTSDDILNRIFSDFCVGK